MFLALETMNGIYQILIYGFYLLSPTSKRELVLSCGNTFTNILSAFSFEPMS